MSTTKSLLITCSCSRHKLFPYVVKLAEPQHSNAVVAVQINCPFNHETYCLKQLTIELPAGMVPKNDENILRG